MFYDHDTLHCNIFIFILSTNVIMLRKFEKCTFISSYIHHFQWCFTYTLKKFKEFCIGNPLKNIYSIAQLHWTVMILFFIIAIATNNRIL